MCHLSFPRLRGAPGLSSCGRWTASTEQAKPFPITAFPESTSLLPSVLEDGAMLASACVLRPLLTPRVHMWSQAVSAAPVLGFGRAEPRVPACLGQAPSD